MIKRNKYRFKQASKILMTTKKSHSAEINRPNTTVNDVTKIDDSTISNFVNDQGDSEMVKCRLINY